MFEIDLSENSFSENCFDEELENITSKIKKYWWI